MSDQVVAVQSKRNARKCFDFIELETSDLDVLMAEWLWLVI